MILTAPRSTVCMGLAGEASGWGKEQNKVLLHYLLFSSMAQTWMQQTEKTALERSWPVPAPQGVSEAEIGSPGLVFTVTPQPLTTVSCLWRIYFELLHWMFLLPDLLFP